MRTLFLGCLLLTSTAWLGCAPAGVSGDFYANIQSDDSQRRIDAIVMASRVKDPNMLPYLVDRLTDPESDVRLFAATALQEITGRSLGNTIFSPQMRAQEQQRWREWLAAGRPAVWPAPATAPATAPAATEGGKP